MATTYTELLQLPKHDTTDPFDITLINNMADLVDAGMAKAYQGKAAHSLLGNGDLCNAVNQRGQASYTSEGYTIDRWMTVGACTVTPSASGVTLEATGGMQWGQRLPLTVNAQYAGQPYTFAVCLSDGSIHIVTGTIPSDPGTYDGPQVAIGSTGFVMSVSNNNGYTFPRIHSAGGTITIKWAALYIGSYTAHTLTEYQPKGYGAELAECQRYFERIGWNSWGSYHASMLLAVSDTGDFRMLQGYKQRKRIDSPTIMLNGAVEGGPVSLRNTMTGATCEGTFTLWHNAFPDRLNAISVQGGTTVKGEVYEAYIDVCADL